MKTKRIGWIDCAKGILISLVVLGHIISNSEIALQNWIYSFHIPAFFILEGITLNLSGSINKSLHEFTKRNMSGLIYPYLIFGVIFLGRSILQYVVGSLGLKQLIDYALLLISFCGVGILWFLPTLFLAKTLFFIAFNRKLYVPLSALIIIALSIYVFGHQMINYDGDVFSLTSVVVFALRSIISAGFICSGYLMYSLYKQLTIKRNILYAICFLFLLVSAVFYRLNGTVDLHIMQLNNPILYLIFAISGGIGILGLSKVLSNYKVLLFWGKNSIVIMLTHTIFLVYKAALILCGKIFSVYPLKITFSFVCAMAVESLLIMIITKRFNWLIKPSLSLRRMECQRFFRKKN